MKTLSFRILSIILCFSILSSSFTVYAQQTDTFADRMNRFKTKVCLACDKVFSDADIIHDNLQDLYDDFVASLDSTAQNAIMALNTEIDIYRYILTSFCNWIKKNKLFGVQEEVDGVPVPDKFKLVIRRIKPDNSIVPSVDFSTPDNINGDANIYDINNFNTNYPYAFGRENLKYWIFTNTLPSDWTTDIWYAHTDSRYNVNWSTNTNFTDYDNKFIFVSQYSNYARVYMQGYRNTNNTITILYGVDNANFYDYWTYSSSNYVVCRDCTFDGEFLNFSTRNTTAFANHRNYIYNNEWHYTNDGGYSLYPGMPFAMNGRNFFNYAYGNYLILADTHAYLFYNGVWYDVPNVDNISFSYPETISRVKVANQFQSLNITSYNNAVNNYITVLNNITIGYPDATLQEILDLLQNLDVSQELSDIWQALNDLIREFEEQQQELEGIKGILTNIKNYCKRIELKLNEFFDKFDSLFLSSGIFFLDAKLDYLYNHLSSEMTTNTSRIVNALNNISVSSNGGGDINFGDFIVDIDATLNVLFTLNNEQKTEIEADIDTLKTPFKWIATLGNNVNDLISSMVRRSAAYSGDSYTNDFSSLDDAFNSNISANIINSDTNGNSQITSVPQGRALDSGYDSLGNGSNSNNIEPPDIKIHFGNSTSDLNYGGDVTVLDLSWYAPYKNIVDNVIVVLAWAFFIVAFYRSIPSLLNGDKAIERTEK